MSDKKDKIIFAVVITVFIIISLIVMLYNNFSFSGFTDIIAKFTSRNINQNVDISSPDVPTAAGDKTSLQERLNLLNEYINSPELKLVNSENPIEENYTPILKTIPKNYSNFPETPRLIDERVYDSLINMLDTAKQSGISIFVYFSYRSYNDQKEVFDKAVNNKISSGMSEENAISEVRKTIAYPGASEHQYGFSADIADGKEYEFNALKDNQTILWLKDNAQNFGFIYRYPENKTDVTGAEFEPWHFRYIGEVHAKYIYEKDITLEEYIAELKKEIDDIKLKLN